MDGDFDVRQRSTCGCIPLLLTMARLGGKQARQDAAILEQEVHTCLPVEPQATPLAVGRISQHVVNTREFR